MSKPHPGVTARHGASPEAIAGAAEVYGAILADPDRVERLRRDLAEIEAREAAERAGKETVPE